MGYDLQRIARTPPTVVLSACDLGLADMRPGDETVGMATALLTAGVVDRGGQRQPGRRRDRHVRDDRATTRGRGRSAARGRPGRQRAFRPAGGFVCLGAG